ncbi:hypothetical protein BT69DRAFT_1334626 [Atractiella rhizophila]|nr:hypothetical protein BT69DRAFT_1334626 [Atractiella rhizophila]
METQPSDDFEGSFCGKTLCPTLVSMIVAFVLWGIGILQFYRCFRIISAKRQPHSIIKVELCMMFILDISDTVAKIVWFARFIRDTVSHGSMGFL